MKFSLKSVLGLMFVFFPFIVFAGGASGSWGGITYTPLQTVTIPGNKNLYSTDILEFLVNLYTFTIALAGALAVIKIVYAGIKYMLSDAFTDKGKAKDEIWASVIGLIVILGSYTLLETINPALVKFNLNIGATSQVSGDGRGLIANSIGGPIGGLSGGGTMTLGGENGDINPQLTAYSPQRKGSSIGKMEGGYESSRAGLDGKNIVRTLDDYVSGASTYVTLAGDPSQYGKTYTIPSLQYTNSAGVTKTLTNVKGYVHDTGDDFKTAGTTHFDIPVGRDYTDAQMNKQNFTK